MLSPHLPLVGDAAAAADSSAKRRAVFNPGFLRRRISNPLTPALATRASARGLHGKFTPGCSLALALIANQAGSHLTNWYH
jgi:hypothetical protein